MKEWNLAVVAKQTRRTETRLDALQIDPEAAGELGAVVRVLAGDMPDNSAHVADQAPNPKVRGP